LKSWGEKGATFAEREERQGSQVDESEAHVVEAWGGGTIQKIGGTKQPTHGAQPVGLVKKKK